MESLGEVLKSLARVAAWSDAATKHLSLLREMAITLGDKVKEVQPITVTDLSSGAFEVQFVGRTFRFSVECGLRDGGVYSDLIVAERSIRPIEPLRIFLREPFLKTGETTTWLMPGEKYKLNLSDRDHAGIIVVNCLLQGLTAPAAG